MVGRHLIITGRVQGVGFRDALQAEAEKLGLAGWVRNCRDGSVEAFLQGNGQAVEALCDWAKRGPPLARVAEVRSSPRAPEPALAGSFERLPSA